MTLTDERHSVYREHAYSASERRSATPGSASSPSRRAARPMQEGGQMATMTRWDPFQDLRSAQDEMAQMSPMLAHALGLHGQPQGGDRATAWAPALDISERKDAYLVTVELPGSRPTTWTSPWRM